MDSAVSLNDVIRRFRNVTAVDGISLEVRPGEVFGVLGHNGAGKTTLLRLINGLLRPHSGTIRVLGLDPVVDGDRVRARTGVLTEYPALDHFLTCAENLHVYASIHGLSPSEGAMATDRALEAMGMRDRAAVPSQELSAGLKQRVALARALVHDPDVLLLDEPTSTLDPMASRRVRSLVGRLARDQGRTVILSTHNLAEAQSMCDRIAIVRRGRLLACGTVNELGRYASRTTVTITVEPTDHVAARRVLVDELALSPLAVANCAAWEVSAEQAAVPAIVTRLVMADVRVLGIVPQRPTLEDIYVRLHEAPVPASGAP